MDSLRQAEASGRAAMADIRQTIGLLRDPHSTVAPAQDLSDLVASFVDAGLKVDYHVTGDPATLSEPVGEAIHRIMREALSNAARHAADGAAEVGLAVTGHHARLCVRNAWRGGGPVPEGHGLAGMRHRARLVDGVLTAGPDGDAWLVQATFPGGR
jgi:signal transduction histidine kinase